MYFGICLGQCNKYEVEINGAQNRWHQPKKQTSKQENFQKPAYSPIFFFRFVVIVFNCECYNSFYTRLLTFVKFQKLKRAFGIPATCPEARRLMSLVKYSFISIQPWRPGLAGTRAQSCDQYGSGTLHPGQVLGGSLPLLSPAFRLSHFSRQVRCLRSQWRERS